MISQLFTHTFKRINNDTIPEVSDNMSYDMALNAVKKAIKGKGFGLTNEGSTEQTLLLSDDIVGAVHVETRDWYVLLLKNGELGYFNVVEETYVSIYNLNRLNKESNDGCGNIEKVGGCEFNFNCEWVNLEYNFWNQCNELHVMFSHNCVFYSVNIDELLDPNRRSHVNCSDIQTFKCDCMPTVKAVKVEGGGALLPNGKYSFSARIINKDGHRSNWFNISNAVSVGGGKNMPGEISSEYINVYISNLSCRYNAIELAVIRQIGDGVTAEVLDRIDYNNSGIAYEYRGRTGEETSISIEEIVTRKVNFLRGRALKIFDGRMFYYQIKNTKNFNTQEWVSTATVKLKLYKVPAHVAHLYSGLQPGERYLIGIAPQMCDGTEQRVGVLNGGEGGVALEQRADDTPTVITGGEGEGGSGSSSNITFDTSKKDEYLPYKDLPKDHHVVQSDGYYTDGCVTNTGECEDLKKSAIDGIRTAVQDAPDDSDENNAGEECPDCGNDPLKRFALSIKKLFSKGIFRGLTISLNRNRKNKRTKQPDGNGMKDTFNKLLSDLENEEVHVPERVKVTDTNSKKTETGGSAVIFDATKTIGEQLDDINLFHVGDIEPKWFSSSEKYPKTRDCGGGYVYGGLAGTGVQLLEIPYIVHFVSSVTGAKSSHTLGIDERNGYVFMVGIGIYGLRELTEADLGKPPCKSQPWKVVYARRDALNSRVLGSGILIDTMQGDVNNRPHAIPRHGVNSRENLDKHIGQGGDLFNHEGQDNDGANIYLWYSPDAILGKIPLIANKFIKLGDMSGDGWRHGLYEKSTKKYGWTERPLDQKGCRETVNLHTFTPSVAEFDILGICKADGDSIIPATRGFDMPICNLGRESAVAIKLSGSAGHDKDRSFIADGEDHFGPVLDARCPFGLAVRDIPNQYGSVVNQSYVDLGLYAKPGATSVEGLVGDSFVNVFNVRRTSYVSDRVGDRTFIASPRRSGIARFFGFGDPTEPPESGDERDPKNMANRYPGQGLMEAANSTGSGSVYFPGVLKCLVVFWAMSRVNPHYRQRGDEDKGEVHAWNLGKLYLDSSVPMGTPWEDSWLNRYYKEIQRMSKLDKLIVVAAIIGVWIGMPLWFIYNGFEVNALWDIPTAILRGVLFAICWIIAILLITPSRIRKLLGLKEQLKDREGGATDENIRQWEDIFRGYSSEYNAGSVVGTSYGIPDPYNTCDCDDCSETIYYRPGGVPSQGINNLIYYTPKQYHGTEINAFKNVLDGNYGEMGTEAGQLQRIFSLNNMLYGLTTDGLWRLSYQSNGDANYRDLDYLLGNGMALGTPHRVGEGIEEGFRGTVDPNSFIVTPYGASWVDYKNRGIVLFNGGTAQLISNNDVSDLMYKYMPFCNGNTCRDQKVGSGVWFSLGYDPDLNRLLVTKKDGAGGGSWTLSYDFGERVWVSAHSYIPNLYLWDRNKMYSVFDKKIWRHNSDKSKQVIYGQYRPFKVWFYSANLRVLPDHAAAMQVSALEFHTIADEIGGAMNRDITFTMGGWSNSHQMTGIFLLDTKHYQCRTHKDIRDKGFATELYRTSPGMWRFNDLLDNIKTKEDPILEYSDCSFFVEYTDNADCRGGDGNKSVMEDYYLRQCLIFDDESKSNIELKLLRVIGYGAKKEN